jgi:pimeloyl-ACP methyl ester carboxylesterase
MAYCEVEPGVNLYYEEFGNGAPFLFIHGGGMSHEMWEQQVYALADDHRVVTVDLRGHGISDKPAHGHTFARLVQDVEVLAAHLGLSAANVVCHGIGGYVGILCALQNPDLVRRLVLVSSGVRFVGTDEARGGFSTELWETYTSGMARNKIDATALLVDRTFFYNKPSPDTRQAVIDTMLQWPLYAMKMLGRDLQNVDLEDRLGELRIPALVLHGRHDTKQRFSGAAHLRSCIKDAVLIAFEESAHNPQLEEVEKFNRVLREFVALGG